MIKHVYYLKPLIVFIWLVIFCCSLTACANDKGTNASTSQGIDVAKENLSTTPSKTTQLSPSPIVVPIVEATPEIPMSTKMQDVQHNEYSVLHEKDEPSYKINVMHDDQYNYTIKLFNENCIELQTVELGWCPGGIELLDVNTDGCTDIVVSTGGTVNETHDLYIWNSASNNFVKVIFEGFDILAWFTIHEGYIENFIRGSSPEESIKEKLIWNGNTLIKESEVGYELED